MTREASESIPFGTMIRAMVNARRDQDAWLEDTIRRQIRHQHGISMRLAIDPTCSTIESEAVVHRLLCRHRMAVSESLKAGGEA